MNKLEKTMFKLCIKCRYHQGETTDKMACGHPHYAHPVDGQARTLCLNAREAGQPCGPEGRLWWPIEAPPFSEPPTPQTPEAA